MNIENKYINHIKSLIEILPDNPGVYQFINEKGEVLYVGKAANLKKRVSSYFTKTKFENNKLKILIRKTADISYFIVSDESDALLLENNLIKKIQPKYNVLLKDDKTFPWICVKNELFPRIFMTRNIIKDGSVYYGPYTSVNMVKTLLELVRKLFPLRTCNYNLSEENIKDHKFKVCLEYHLGNCNAPCIGRQSIEDYKQSLHQIHQILKGNIFQIISNLKNTMKHLADNYHYEQANIVKEKVDLLEKYRSKSTIVNPKIKNVEVYSVADGENEAYVNYLKVINGCIVQTQTIEIKKKMSESVSDLLSVAIGEIRQRSENNASEIIIPKAVDLHLKNVKFTIPERGDKKQLLDLSERNARIHMLEKRRKRELIRPDIRINRLLEKTMKDLRLKEKPIHIECFDNSNIQGKHPVAACVVFKYLRPSKKDYRHFNIKSVTGSDDFASMKEIIYRRYKKILDDKKSLPQLVIVDGGKGQLNAAVDSMEELKIRGKIAVIGIAKRLEEIYFPDDPFPQYLNKNSETLRLIQQIRNEAHRFGINFHRNKRSRNMVVSELDNINGIGEKTKEVLLLNFGSVESLKKSDPQKIINLIGEKKAEILLNAIKTESKYY